MQNIIKLPPFKRLCITIGNLPTSQIESMSYYEAILWLTHYLESVVIPAIDNNADALTELQGLMTQLQEYVDNYFENLDVQEEINNKLDAMVEAGTLQEIISEYLNSTAIFAFDTVDDMTSATNLIDGSFARTLGYYSLNDGGGALFKIRNRTFEDVVDNCSIILINENIVAEMIIENKTINIKQFGAKIDDETDDSDAIQLALDYISTKEGGTVIVNEGTAIIGKVLRISSNTHLTGVKGKSLIKASSDFETVVYQSLLINKHTPMDLSETHDDSIIIDNLKFDNNGKNNAGYDGLIQFRGVTNSKIKDIEMTVNGHNCWGIILFSANQQVTVDSVRIDNISEDNTPGGCLWVRSGLAANGDENKKSIGLHVTNSTFTSTAKDELICISEGLAGGWTECEVTNCELVGKAETNLPSNLMVVSPTVSTDNSFVKALLNNITITGKCVNAGIITGYENFEPNCLQAVISNLIINLSAGNVGIQSKDQNQIFTNCKVNVPEGKEVCNYGTFINCNFYGKARGSFIHNCYINSPTYEGCENCRIVSDSIIYGNTYGLKYYGEYMNPMISNNKIYSNNSGIYGQFVSNKGMKDGIISGNIIQAKDERNNSGTSAIDIRYSTNMLVANNICYATADDTASTNRGFQYNIRYDNTTGYTASSNIRINV